MPKHYQHLVHAIARETAGWMTARYDSLNPVAIKRLMSAGAVLRPFPQDVMEACWKAAHEIYADLNKTNPHFKKMYDSLTAFRADSYAWYQVAELAYDSFQMRMRTRS